MITAPLSFAQQRLWFLGQMEGVSENYHIPLGFRLRGELDRAALRTSLDALVARHEPLRTSFVLVDGDPVQRIDTAQRGFLLLEHDLRRAADATGDLAQLQLEEATAAFDLEAGPLIRGRLIQLADAEHVLLITMHHIVSDGWSMGVLLRELNLLYRGYRDNRPAVLAPLDIQYADYAAWQREHLSGGVLQEQLDYWRAALAGIPDVHQVPTDRPRPAQQDFAGEYVGVEIDAELTRELKALSRAHGTTLFTTLLAAWGLVLARLSGVEDVVIGTPVANRTRTEIEGLIGFFVNTLALRLDISADHTVGSLLEHVKAQTVAAQERQDVPFEQVVEALAPPRTLAYTPLFQVVFGWQNDEGGEFALPGLTVSGIAPPTAAAQYDLKLDLAERGARIVGGLHYATALFDRPTIERHVGYLRQALAAMVAAETARIGDVSLVPERELHQVLVEWNATDAVAAPERCVHELFEAQAAQHPTAVAVVFDDAQLTYGELNARANRLARYLRGIGVRPDTRVAVCVERSLDLVVALLAVLKAGGGYVPLDPSYPLERLQFMLADSAPVAVLTHAPVSGAVRELLAGGGVAVVDLQRDASRWSSEAAENLVRGGLALSHLAYVIYTSGTTGRPKGVMVTHANVSRLFAASQELFGFGERDVWTLFHSFAFDFSVWEMWGALVYGGRLVVVAQSTARSPVDFYALVCEQGVTVLNQTPSAFRQLMAVQGDDGHAHRLRTVIFGGEALETGMLAPWLDRAVNRGVRLVNMYGITETTVHVTYQAIEPKQISGGGSVIGRRLGDLRVYVLDAALRPVPVGVAGELYVGGAGVARGYLNRPELTAQRFIPSPFVAGDRLYKTGDVARYLRDGRLEYLGRNDMQVKLRGFRIELGEIEARLSECAGIRDAVVLAREDVPGDKRLTAYYTSRDGAEISAEALRAHLLGALPEYMVPAAYVRLASLPLTANGKLDRAALPAPDGSSYAVRAYEPPLGAVEEAIARIWCELLQVERVGRYDNFFELGGHSLLAVRVLSDMRAAGVHADIRTLFSAPTLRALAAAAGSESGLVAVPPNDIPCGAATITPAMLPLVELSSAEIERIVATVPGGASNVQDIYPLAALQEGILFHHLLSDERDPYLVRALQSFDSRARLDRFVAAFQAVIDRHDILRTAVVWEGLREPVQVVWRHAPLVVEDVTADPAAGDVLEQLTARFDPRHYRIDVQQAPLFRVAVAHDAARERWVMALLFHHLVDDQTSLKVMFEEIEAHLVGEAARLPRPLPFRNVIAQARLGISREEHEAFFRDMLGDVEEPTAPLGLTDVRRDGSGVAQGRRVLEPSLSRRLRAHARSLGVSTASLCHVAWAQVLGALSGRDDVVFGTVLFGRMHGGEGGERVLGLLINTLPLRIELGAAAKASVLQAHRTLGDLMRHEHASLALAQRCSAVAAPAPLFTTLLNYRNARRADAAPQARRAWEGIEFLSAAERTNYPLTMSVDDSGTALRLTAQVVVSVDPERVCTYMQTALERLVDALDRAPSTPLRDLSVLPDDERRRVVADWNDTDAAYPPGRCVHELFEAQAAKSPHAVAVVHAGTRLTYGELNARANQLARYLRSAGVAPDARVALCFERSFDMVVALLAVLKAGGAYVPLDPSYPLDRLRYMLGDSAPVAVLTHAQVPDGVQALLRGCGVAAVDVERDRSLWAAESAGDLERGALTPRHLAYVIYTSGTTGRPKGVMLEHGGLSNVATAKGRLFNLDAASRTLQFASMSFDAFVSETVMALCHGGSLVVPEPETILAGDALVRIIRDHKITHVTLPPAVLSGLSPGAGLESVRTLVAAGDRLTEPLVKAWAPGRLLINAYGPTESTICATTFECDASVQGDPPIGRPIPNTRAYVLDTARRPVPIGVAGELYVGGAQVARGYLNRPELTAERFVASPFVAGDRLYKTGDVARFLPDGNIEYLGRRDFQVKIRGFRIELGEIEAHLSEHAGIRDAVVLAREDVPGEKRLVAYYTSRDGEDPSAEALRLQLFGSLPEYMVPAAYVHVESLPLTPNGKLDRAALPAPEVSAYALGAYEPPLGDAEEKIAALWRAVLNVERVGRHDDFFDLGGHSLLAMGLLARLHEICHVEVELSTLFAHPTLHELARVIEQAAKSMLPAIGVADRSRPLPLSLAQQRLWFLTQIDGVSEAYHMPLGLRLRGALDRPALRNALDALIARHESLRTTFSAAGGDPVQCIGPAESGFSLLEHDLRGQTDASVTLALMQLEEANAAFDLEAGPLIRGRLIRLADTEHVLLITMHHIVSDGRSIGVLLAELSALYRAYREGEADPLPALTIQYADYAAWQREHLGGAVLQEQLAYWQEALAGIPEVHQIPTDRPHPASQDFAGEHVRVDIDAELTRKLHALSRAHGTTMFTTLLTAWGALLARLSGQEDVVIGTPVANRTRTEIEGLIGFFVNTLALRLHVLGDRTVGSLLEHVTTQTLAAQERQDVPFERVVEALAPPRSLAHTPLFQVMFSWQNGESGEFALPGLDVSGVAVPTTVAKFDLMLSLGEADGRITGALVYAGALFDRSTIERHVGYLRQVLAAMVADDEQAVSALPLLAPAERRKILVEWNATEAAFPSDHCVHELFEAQAAKTPGAVAVVFGDTQLTYGELDARSNQLARYLRSIGVAPDTRVAICVERSLEMAVALFAVLKAGGAYVPLDPSYPLDRLRFMLGDSAPVAVLTHSQIPSAVQQMLHGCGAALLDLERDASRWATEPASTLDRGALRPEHLAYVIYTSGSTGRPKGVMNEHRAVMNRLHWAQEAYRLSYDDRVLQKTPFSFDVSVWEVFWPLLTGARLVMARSQGHKDPAYLTEVIRAQQVTTVHFVPSMLRTFLDDGAAGTCSSLKRVICSGEALTASVVRDVHAQLPGVQLSNLYGPTEAAVDVTAWTCRHGDTRDNVPIGRPIANARTYVLDAQREPVPIGVIGQLHIGGIPVARGYLNRPELTAERFIPSPFVEGDRLYATGDLTRYLPDGTIEYVGRNDFQVKIRGFRIELGEIEARLREHAGIRDAVVLAREDVPGEKRLTAYYTSRDGELSVDALRAHLLGALPEYMVPAAYVRMEALPLTPNGKLDRTALPAPDGSAYTVRAYEAPNGGVEETIARIWSELLGVERVGRYDNFFELGGHSLLAVRVLSAMRAAGVHADIRTLFSAPTLRALAEAAGGESGLVSVPPNRIAPGETTITPAMLPLAELSETEIERVVSTVPGGASNVQDIYPLTALQEGILFHHLVTREGDPYLLRALQRFDSRARLNRFVAALQAVMDRHDILRTAVVWEGLREPVQVVWRCAPLVVDEVALDPADGDVLEQLTARFDPRHYRIDVQQAPLIRVAAAHDVATDRWVAVLLFHHLIDDQTSLNVMFGEIEAHLVGESARLPRSLPFRNVVAQARLGISREEHEAFFRDMLGDVAETTAPFGLTDIVGDGSRIAQAKRTLAPSLARRLRDHARALGVSTASVCHVGWAQALGALCGREDVVFGTVLFGRMQGGEGADRALGLLINTLPVRIKLGDDGVEESVRRTHQALADLMRHEHASLALAQRCSAVEPPAPLFSALFNYRNARREDRAPNALRGWEGIEFLGAEERTNYPLVFSIDDFGADLGMTAQVAAPLDPEQLCAYVQTALEQLVDALDRAPNTPLRALTVLPESELHQVLVEWNATSAVAAPEHCVHELFEAQAAHHPSAVAVVFEDAQLTYGELNARANRLARYLRGIGVGPDTRVAVCVERSLDLVVGLVAVLKAGGAYVPLDPSYPLDRLKFMLADSAPVAVLTHAQVPGAVRELLAGGGVAMVDLQSDASRWSSEAAENLDRDGLALSHLAYVIYTSGTTGRPKGVMVTHANVSRLFAASQELFHFGERDVWTLFHSFAFDFSVWEMWGALVYGGRLVVVAQSTARSPVDFYELVCAQGVTVLNQTPSAFRQLMAVQGDDGHAHRLRAVIFGGEALDAGMLAPWLDRAVNRGVRLVNMYGITETTVHVTYEAIEPEQISGGGSVIGRRLGDLRVYVLDAALRPVPVGVAGELYVGGAGVARGYLNRPELTAQRFIASPFVAGDRLYKTGDVARYLRDGRLEYLGRNDMQVKLRGFRIELGEIEARLSECAGIRDAVVLAREDVPGDKRLTAYYTSRDGAEISAETLRAHLLEALPEYMVPAAYVRLESLPLTSNGKLDRAALPAPDGSSYAVRAYEPPAGTVEEAIARIWCELLQVERVGRYDNFFELGGHSLLAVRVLSAMRAVGLHTDVQSFYKAASLHDIGAMTKELTEIRI